MQDTGIPGQYIAAGQYRSPNHEREGYPGWLLNVRVAGHYLPCALGLLTSEQQSTCKVPKNLPS